MGKEKEDDQETGSATIWKQTSRKQDTVGENWRDCLTTRMPDGIILAACALEAATKALIDYTAKPDTGWRQVAKPQTTTM